MSINSEIASNNSRVFRRAYIKRRNSTTGLFESEWQEITNDVKRWGKLSTSVDGERYATFRFPTAKLVMANDEGRYNPSDDINSLWFGFAPQERSLLKIEAGFLQQTFENGIWTNTEFPTKSNWDNSDWDSIYQWDGDSKIFVGLLSGDIYLSDKNEVTLNVKPLNEVFRQFSAANINFLTSTGMTASQFIEGLRDMTDGSGSFVFRPFFNDTTSSWDIASTSVNYAFLDSTGAKNVRDKTVWQVIERLTEAENYVAYIKNNGTFVFGQRNTSTGGGFDFGFFGNGLSIGEAGRQIKGIERFGKRYSKYYSRVEVKHKEADTLSSTEVVQDDLEVTGGNTSWLLGQRTFKIENTWIPTSTVANTIAQSIFDDVSAVKDEIDFTTSFVPHLNILESCTITYDSSPVTANSLWDVYDWADTAGSADTGAELIFDASGGDAIKLSGDEFRLLTVSIDLDNLECKFKARRA